MDKEWDFEERVRGHVICSLGAGTIAMKAKTDKKQFLTNVDCVGRRKRQLCIK